MDDLNPGTSQAEDNGNKGNQGDPGNNGPAENEPKGNEDALGDAGKKALQEERNARKAAERELTELKAEVSRLRRSNAAVKDVDLEAIKSEIRQEFDRKLLSAEIKATAAGKLADPADAMRYGDYFEGLAADDADGIKSALEKLLKDKPYLAAKPGAQWGDVGGGPREVPADPEPRNAVERMARAYARKAE